jgi:hypothetical protein
MSLCADPHSYTEATKNPFWEVVMALRSTMLSYRTKPKIWFHFRKEEILFDVDGYFRKRWMKMVRSVSINLVFLLKFTLGYMELINGSNRLLEIGMQKWIISCFHRDIIDVNQIQIFICFSMMKPFF